MLDIGTKAPNFKLPDMNGEEHSLSDFLGKKIILYFYPKDNTPGCTKEAVGFSQNFNDFDKLNTIVIGISKDSSKSHMNFVKKYDIPFLLLSDTTLDILKLYDVYKEKKLYGKISLGTVRTTFIINEEGIIEKIYDKVKAANHAEEILAYLLSEKK